MDDTFAKRLINARKMRCLSQRELCKKLNGQISSTAIEKYEKGLMMPSSTVLILLSKALDMKLDYFFRPFTLNIDMSKFEFRKKSSLGAKKLESIKYAVWSEIEKYVEIEDILDISNSFCINYGNIVVEGEDDARNQALRLRNDLKIGLDAIVSAVELVESLGIKLIELDTVEKFSGTCITADSIPVIIINKNMNPELKRFTIFHELGHLILKFEKQEDEEKMCDIFASEVLIPSDRFKKLIGDSRHDISLVELQAIQREYGISIDALMIKAKQLNIISEKRYVAYCKKKKELSHFNANVESSIFPDEPVTRFSRLVYRALASELITFSKAANLLDKSIEEVRNSLNLM